MNFGVWGLNFEFRFGLVLVLVCFWFWVLVFAWDSVLCMGFGLVLFCVWLGVGSEFGTGLYFYLCFI